MDKVKCVFKSNNDCCNIYAWSCDYADSCKGNPNCIIKRLQAENEKLKQVANDSIIEQEKLIAKVNELQQENEELQGKYNGLNANYNSLKFKNERLKEESEKTEETAISLLNIQNELAKSCVIYKQTLQDIRKICKNSHTSASEDYYRTADKIQDKINEVIGAKE